MWTPSEAFQGVLPFTSMVVAEISNIVVAVAEDVDNDFELIVTRVDYPPCE